MAATGLNDQRGTRMQSKFRKSARAVVVVAAIATLAAACGDDSGKSSSATTAAAGWSATSAGGAATTAGGSATTTANPLGAPNKATGTPVKIGYITEGLAPNVDLTGEKLAAQATFKYANDYLGGVGGHVIQPVVCETKQDPAVAADCANQMVQENVAAVLVATSGVIASFAPPIAKAGIPMFAYQVADPTVSSNKDSAFILSNALTSFLLPAGVAQQQ